MEAETTTMPRWRNAASALAVACGAAALAWLVLRQPLARKWLLELVPHRYPVPMAWERQLLAPRSILLAALLVGMAGLVALLVRRYRTQAFVPLPVRQWLLAVLVSFSAMLAVAPVVNLHAFFLRQFHAPVWGISPRGSVEAYLLPQAIPDAKAVRGRFGPGERVALVHPGENLHNYYLLNALASPVEFFDLHAIDNQDTPSLARKRGIAWEVIYTPEDRAHPIRERRLR